MNRFLVAACAVLVGCQQGPKGDTGAQGPAGPSGVIGSTGQQGIPGPQGPPGDAGPQGLQGAMGLAGQVVVVVAADGGSVVVDGGVAIVVGPPGPAGAPGPMGQTLFVFADAGSVVIDAGVVVVAGPAGPAGPQGTPGQSVVGSSEPSGANCATGGVRLVSASGTAYVCNGAQGTPGQSVGFVAENPGTTCPSGGVRLLGANGSSTVCNGVQGIQGSQGPPGQALFVIADGGTAAIDGGVVIVAGPLGPQGPRGGPGGLTIRATDGGLFGYLYDDAVFLPGVGCSGFIAQRGGRLTVVGQDIASYIYFATPDCTGQVYLIAPLPNWGPARCVEGYLQGAMYAVRQPFQPRSIVATSQNTEDGGCQISSAPFPTPFAFELTRVDPVPLPATFTIEP